MKRWQFLLIVSLILSGCAPVISKSYLRESPPEVSFKTLREKPDEFRGNLYVFGGVIVRSSLTQEGLLIEAMHVPVDRRGYFENRGRSRGRFLGIIPPNGTVPDPEVFRRGRRITIAGEFLGLRQGRIDEAEYTYPVFRIKDVHLWKKERRYYPAYYYDPWFSPYPYYYWYPWWSHPYYYYDYRYRQAPVYRRSRPPDRPVPPQEPSLRRPERPPPQREHEREPERERERRS